MRGKGLERSHPARMPKFGRNRPHPSLVEKVSRFAKYRTTEALVVPDAWDYSVLATAALATMLANGPDDTVTIDPYAKANGLGCCTCAAPGHSLDVITAGGENPAIITADQVITLYCLSCGYVIGQPSTDQGGDELTVLNYIAANGIDGKGLHQIAGVANADATNTQEVREGIFLTGSGQICLELPNVYVNPFPGPDQVWDVGTGADYEPNDQQGHCVDLDGSFTTNGPNGQPAFGGDTWGIPIWITTRALAYYCAAAQNGSVNFLLTKEWISKSKGTAPNSLDWTGLASDFPQVGGAVAP